MSENLEICTEACRLLANISRFRLIDISKTERSSILQICTLLLDHSDTDLIKYASGISMNLLKSRELAEEFIKLNGPEMYYFSNNF